MKYKTGKRLLIVILLLSILCGACSKKGSAENKSDDGKNRRLENSNGGLTGEETLEFSDEEYKNALLAYRVPINDIKADYENEVKKLQSGSGENYDFSACDFSPVPDFSSVKILTYEKGEISVDDSIKVFEDMLKKYGMEDKVDLSKELTVNVFKGNSSKAEPVLENKDSLDSGNNFYVHNPDFSIQMCENGMLSFSDGEVNRRLGYPNKDSAYFDAVLYTEKASEKGSYRDMKDKTITVSSGDVNIKEAAENVAAFFMNGTPFKPSENVGVDITEAAVINYSDELSGISFSLRRTYDNIPFAFGGTGVENYKSRYQLDYDMKLVYTLDGKTVNSFIGYNEHQKIKTVSDGYSEILSLSDAEKEMEAKFAEEMHFMVDKVELCYVPLHWISEDKKKVVSEIYIYPCWAFLGSVNGVKMHAYVDALTGDLYYYTN